MRLRLFLISLCLQVPVVASQVEETARDVAAATSTTEKQVCQNVRTLHSGGNLRTEVCEPYWPKTEAIVVTAPRDPARSASGDASSAEDNSQSGTETAQVTEIAMPSWADQVRDRPESYNKSSKDYEGNSSPAQMAERGITMASRAELRAMETLFTQTKNNVAERCCGTNRECAGLFRQVRLQFCTNPRALTHPNEPDPCTSSEAGVYTQSDDEMYMQWWLYQVARDPEGVREATRTATLAKRPQLRNRLGQVAPGFVKFSRYERADSGETLWTFRHELGHACSSIRRQIAARNGSRITASDDYNPDPKAYCKYSGQTFQQYTFMAEYMRPENAREAGECISNGIREEFRNKNNESYIANACYGSKVEEGLAEAFAILSAAPENVMYNLERSCTFPPTRVHFTGHKIIKCIVANSARFRDVVLAAPVCRADQPAEPANTGTEAGLGEGGVRPFMNNTLLTTPSPVPQTPAPASTPVPAPSSSPTGEGQR